MVDYISNIQINGESKEIGGENFSGPWTISTFTVVESASMAKAATKTVDLSTYLPDDGCDYLVQFMTVAATGSTSGNSAEIDLTSSIALVRALYTNTRSSSTETSTKSGFIPIAADSKSLTVTQNGGATASGINVWLRGYCRMGKNDSLTDTIQNVKIQGAKRPIAGDNFNGGYTNGDISSIASGISLAASATNNYDLSTYLPDDDSPYLLYVYAYGNTAATSGNAPRIKVVVDGIDYYIYCQRTRTSSARIGGGCAQVYIKPGLRTISITNSGTGSAASLYVKLTGFRKLGLNDPANSYIENISVDGATHALCGDYFDGTWVTKSSNLYSATTTPGTQYTLDLSTILPDDGYNYELLIDAWIWTTTTSGRGAEMYVASDIFTNRTMLVRCNTRSSSSHCNMGSMIIPVGSTRELYIYNGYSSYASGTATVNVRACRRLGLHPTEATIEEDTSGADTSGADTSGTDTSGTDTSGTDTSGEVGPWSDSEDAGSSSRTDDTEDLT